MLRFVTHGHFQAKKKKIEKSRTQLLHTYEMSLIIILLLNVLYIQAVHTSQVIYNESEWTYKNIII